MNNGKQQDKIQAEFVTALEKPHATEAMLQAREREANAKKKHSRSYIFLMCFVVIAACLYGQYWLSLIMIVAIVLFMYLTEMDAEIMLAVYAAAPIPIPIRIASVLMSVVRPLLGNLAFLVDFMIVPIAITTAALTMKNEFKRDSVKTWSQIFKTKVKDSSSTIDKYWKDLGLRNIDGSNIMISAMSVRPDQTYKTGLDMSDHVPVTIEMRADKELWAFSDLTDSMHVKSIAKRLQSIKVESQSCVKQEFYDEMMVITETLPLIKKERRQLLVKALSTEGSAGEFAKRTTLEPIWKDHTDETIVKTWQWICDEIFNMARMGQAIPSDLTEYMLYRKKEIMKRDESNNPKVTRVMQAANLFLRVPDSLSFGEYNEAVVASRETGAQQVGINIITELKLIMPYYQGYVTTSMDFSDFDGCQAPYQMECNKHSRTMYAIRNRQSLGEIAYIREKYNIHGGREVSSNNGIKIRMVGQQASGDITTSDDNTMRTATFCRIINKVFKRNGIDAKAYCQGDDVTVVAKGETEELGDFCYRVAREVASSIGWTIKEAEINVTGQQDNGVLLGHSVELCVFKTTTGRVTIPMSIRTGDRSNAKFVLAAEQSPELSITTRENIVAKMLSYAFSLPGRPDMVLCAAGTAVLMAAGLGKTKGRFTWKYTSIVPGEAFKTSATVAQAMGVIFDITKTKIKTDLMESQMVSYINELNAKLTNVYGKELDMPTTIVMDGWLDNIGLDQWVKNTCTLIARRRIITQGQSVREWWRTDTLVNLTNDITAEKKKVYKPSMKYCKHAFKQQFDTVEVYPWPVTCHVLCPDCFDTAERNESIRNNIWMMSTNE